MDGVVKLVPVPNDVPPEDAAYQFMVPELAVAPKITVPESHREPGVVPVMTGEVKQFGKPCCSPIVIFKLPALPAPINVSPMVHSTDALLLFIVVCPSIPPAEKRSASGV